MKCMPWHSFKRFIQYLKLDFPLLQILTTKTTQHIPLHSVSLHSGKRASLQISWTQSPISAFHFANPSRLGWEGTLHSRAKIVN